MARAAKPWLVVGGDGLIGRALVRQLAGEGRAVLASTRRRGVAGPAGRILELAQDPSGWTPPQPVSVAFLLAAAANQLSCCADPEVSRKINVDHTVALARRLIAPGRVRRLHLDQPRLRRRSAALSDLRLADADQRIRPAEGRGGAAPAGARARGRRRAADQGAGRRHAADRRLDRGAQGRQAGQRLLRPHLRADAGRLRRAGAGAHRRLRQGRAVPPVRSRRGELCGLARTLAAKLGVDLAPWCARPRAPRPASSLQTIPKHSSLDAHAVADAFALPPPSLDTVIESCLR